ncbi:MAG: hypothetical protein ACD_75C00373G0004 [uncultured bacterium]|nr:MAG: hypothetical protein ACD_75C00373G0004 [uncultured bacterium]
MGDIEQFIPGQPGVVDNGAVAVDQVDDATLTDTVEGLFDKISLRLREEDADNPAVFRADRHGDDEDIRMGQSRLRKEFRDVGCPGTRYPPVPVTV